MPNAVHDLAPHAAHRVTHGGAHAIAHSVHRHRAHHAAHVLAPGVALGGGDPTVAPGAAPILGQAIPVAPTGGPTAPPPCINIDALFEILEQEVARL